jgi:tRNA guanosine-2'-O-methyltransferase
MLIVYILVLFYQLPKLLKFPNEELISSVAFMKVNANDGMIPFGYDEKKYIDVIISGTPSSFMRSALHKYQEEICNSTEKLNINSSLIQRKITPWQSLMKADIELKNGERLAKQRNQIIVVATLISKTLNLGGLCRTCEIFNAELS